MSTRNGLKRREEKWIRLAVAVAIALVGFACRDAKRDGSLVHRSASLVAVGVSSAPPLSVPRSHHTATRLVDGRILVCGGYTSIGFTTDSCEIVDPATTQVITAAGMSDGGGNC